MRCSMNCLPATSTHLLHCNMPSFIAVLLALCVLYMRHMCVIYIQMVISKKMIVFHCLILILQDSHEEGSNTSLGVGGPPPRLLTRDSLLDSLLLKSWSCRLIIAQEPGLLSCVTRLFTLQHTATHGNTRQHTAIYCNFQWRRLDLVYRLGPVGLHLRIFLKQSGSADLKCIFKTLKCI